MAHKHSIRLTIDQTESSQEELSYYLEDTARSLRLGYRSGLGWNTEEVEEDER